MLKMTNDVFFSDVFFPSYLCSLCVTLFEGFEHPNSVDNMEGIYCHKCSVRLIVRPGNLGRGV
jgi:DNA-directed RNA polymerase subunit RPC12/RpoP